MPVHTGEPLERDAWGFEHPLCPALCCRLCLDVHELLLVFTSFAFVRERFQPSLLSREGDVFLSPNPHQGSPCTHDEASSRAPGVCP